MFLQSLHINLISIILSQLHAFYLQVISRVLDFWCCWQTMIVLTTLNSCPHLMAMRRLKWRNEGCMVMITYKWFTTRPRPIPPRTLHALLTHYQIVLITIGTLIWITYLRYYPQLPITRTQAVALNTTSKLAHLPSYHAWFILWICLSACWQTMSVQILQLLY